MENIAQDDIEFPIAATSSEYPLFRWESHAHTQWIQTFALGRGRRRGRLVLVFVLLLVVIVLVRICAKTQSCTRGRPRCRAQCKHEGAGYGHPTDPACQQNANLNIQTKAESTGSTQTDEGPHKARLGNVMGHQQQTRTNPQKHRHEPVSESLAAAAVKASSSGPNTLHHVTTAARGAKHKTENLRCGVRIGTLTPRRPEDYRRTTQTAMGGEQSSASMHATTGSRAADNGTTKRHIATFHSGELKNHLQLDAALSLEAQPN